MAITKTSAEGVIKKMDVEFDTPYFQEIADEINADRGTSFTAAELEQRLADQIMDEAYYTFQNLLEVM
jgi:hypothetical protein